MLKWLPPCSPSIIGKSIWDADEVFYSWHFVTQSGPDTFAKRYSFTDDASPTTRHNTLSDVPINRIYLSTACITIIPKESTLKGLGLNLCRRIVNLLSSQHKVVRIAPVTMSWSSSYPPNIHIITQIQIRSYDCRWHISDWLNYQQLLKLNVKTKDFKKKEHYQLHVCPLKLIYPLTSHGTYLLKEKYP